MEGVVQYGTGHSLSNYNIPVQKAGKTGTTNALQTDGLSAIHLNCLPVAGLVAMTSF